jgi:Tol biopolymer transport system component
VFAWFLRKSLVFRRFLPLCEETDEANESNMPALIGLIILLIAVPSYAQEASVPLRLTPKRITNVIDSYPMSSPDGSKIVFESNRTGSAEIYTMDVDGKNLVQLTHNKASNHSPVWSPDGSKIVFASDGEQQWEIYIMNADGSNLKRLTNQAGDDGHPHWSPDGKRIVFNSARTTPDLKANWSKQFHKFLQ